MTPRRGGARVERSVDVAEGLESLDVYVSEVGAGRFADRTLELLGDGGLPPFDAISEEIELSRIHAVGDVLRLDAETVRIELETLQTVLLALVDDQFPPFT